MGRIKLGVLGVSGHFEKRVVLPLQKSSIIETYAIASRSKDKAADFAKKYGIPVSYSSYEELLKDKAVEIVYIPLPNNMHSEWIKKSADSGKHIICEKPITMNTAEAKDCLNYAAKKGVLVMEAFMYRFHPQWNRAMELMKTGEIGKINSIHTFFGFNNTDASNIRNLLETGGGAIYDLGCYASSSARFLLQSEPKRVISIVSRDKNFGTDILTSGILEFGETRTLFTISTQTFPHQKVTVYGTGGILTIDVPFNTFPDVPGKVIVKTDVGTREILTAPENHYLLEFESFGESIRNKKPSPLPTEDAINNMKVLDALFRSEKSGNWENVI